MKFLLHSHFPAGHAYPMQALAQALVARGHAVVWLTSPDNEARVRAVPGALFVAARALADLDAPLARVHVTGLFTEEPRLLLDRRLAAQVADYRAVLAAGFAPHVLVVDVLPHGARALCDLAEIPVYATLGVVPLYTSNASAPLPASGQAPASHSLTSWLRIAVGALRHAWNQWALLPLRLRRVINLQRAALGLDSLPYGEPAEYFSYSGHLHLQASSPTLEFNQLPRPRQHNKNTAFVGPLVTRPNVSSNPQLPSWWPQVISHERVVGITQGTLAMDPTSLIIPSIQALQHEPGTLLVVVSPHAKEIESRVGSPPNVRFAEWLPYHVLLPQLCLLITNGGYGSITQALSHGVPLLCAGQSEDKRDTAARVVWSGVGVDLQTDSPSPDQVRAAAREIFHDDSYQARARMLGSELNALGGADRACDLLEELVRMSTAD
ncbi:UDP-glucoronosyl and UDP-glucosyl transferase domain-containing protein [Hirsutella rhossiliensis]|uniref:UDP-glucoronosyl and UDP-glucosyl transferase domain-containing protein n=1 Tax=Hirsutella rhossiliensis TaxID=111463 RepID=A0A9P8MR81_9HYPO|nr:UDP-glucoronosyl and UDP-glucosyl transferase domain-containing protein [Hirsutella rhossiliensis]KAH0959694.1 UDP-glucoronosyl and UDP-glucosyl transferase domain-containing protein [Hirsutella rhossiliensis]